MNEKILDPKDANLKDLVKNGKKVRFSYYRDHEFWYQHEDGLLFPISLQEANAGRATFLAEDKAIYFMRWMKKYIEAAQPEECECPSVACPLHGLPDESASGGW
jgi:hypothetical protein